MLTEEQTKIIKEQILKQIENFPPDKKEQVRRYILSLNDEQLEEFVIKNKLIRTDDEKVPCTFCNIASKKIYSVPIYEDESYLAVLEINPLSKGHSLLIPKEHIAKKENLDKQARKTAEKLGKKMMKKLGAEKILLEEDDSLNHAIINIIPQYKNEKLERKQQATTEELAEISKKIGTIGRKNMIKREKSNKIEERKQEVVEIIKLNRRVP